MRFLLRFIPSTRDRTHSLRVVRGIARSIGAKAVNAKWTSYGALELDIFTDSRADFETFIAAIEPLGAVEFAKDLQVSQPFPSKERAVGEAASLFDAERFWEAHEVLESLWRVAEGKEKTLLQGLILVCAAFVHVQKGEDTVALGVARRALAKLHWDEPSYYGIPVESVRSMVDGMVKDGKLSLFGI